MPNYRRAWHLGGTYFFTINLLERSGNALLIKHIDALRAAIRAVKQSLPFEIHAWVVLPDHMHCVIELSPDASDFATRWRLIIGRFSKLIPPIESRSVVRARRGERGIWQRRYREHLIRDEKDFAAHMDYVHINPLKHGLVKRVAGVYPGDWAGGDETLLMYGD